MHVTGYRCCRQRNRCADSEDNQGKLRRLYRAHDVSIVARGIGIMRALNAHVAHPCLCIPLSCRAHRLNTIMESTRIMVLDKGYLAEFDTPQNLINRPGSLFGLMVATADGVKSE